MQMWMRTAMVTVLVGLLGAGCRPAESRRGVISVAAEGRQDGGAAAALATSSPKPDGSLANLSPEPPASDTTPEQAPAQVDRLLVPGDRVASIVRSKDGAAPVTVFMPGMCSNANAYLQTFPEAARKHGGVVAIDGDQPCGQDGFRSFSWDAGRQHARIEAALAAAGLSEIPRQGVTLVGYSQGAALAEQLVQRWPDRYARIVLIGAPTDPSPRSFVRARALVTMSCDRDVPARMKQAAVGTARSGVPATYFEMPGCTHGNVTEGERIFDATFDWLRDNERATDPRAAAVRIAGSPAS
jgi:pimeloyl-ACP methyl ester carboxylesterase